MTIYYTSGKKEEITNYLIGCDGSINFNCKLGQITYDSKRNVFLKVIGTKESQEMYGFTEVPVITKEIELIYTNEIHCFTVTNDVFSEYQKQISKGPRWSY